MAPSALDGPTGGYRNAPVSAPGVNALSGSPPPAWGGGLPGGVLSVRPTELMHAVSAFQEAAAAASQAANTAPHTTSLSDTVTSDTAPWGADPLGAAFGSRYTEPARQVPAALEALAKVLHETADRLGRTTRGFVDADDQAAAMVKHHARD
ncbi:hypothetical protein [Amycolatopsis minnesotensis]|uniref:Excreted virulence factor EspC (Type VII ESX diderm) n=1 Tax=Amycolatopsis minnesotensis TaxID=337894 RepID=A0ABP5DL78_9PSEU